MNKKNKFAVPTPTHLVHLSNFEALHRKIKESNMATVTQFRIKNIKNIQNQPCAVSKTRKTGFLEFLREGNCSRVFELCNAKGLHAL